MSGYKHATVTISQEEYRRLQEADVRKRFKEFTRISMQDSGQDETILNLIKEMESRELQLQNALNSLSQNPNENEDGVLQNILAQNRQYYEHLAAILRDSDSNIHDSVAYLGEEFNQALNQERENVFQSIQALVYEQETSQRHEYTKGETALEWLNRCGVLVDYIQSQFDYQRFSPGQMDRILRNLEFAENNLANGFSEVSIQNCQQAYLDLSDLNLELEQSTLQWEAMYEMTLRAINELIYQMEANSNVHGLDLQGNFLPGLVDLDFWTYGKFRRLLDHCSVLSVHFQEDRNILTMEDIERVYNQVLPAVRESLESLVFEARLNALNSQLRMNIAEKALEALEQHGFVLDRAGYSDDDMRTQFTAQLDCADGSQVSIQVLPTENSKAELANELVVITTHPQIRTEHEARLQWEELVRALSQHHLLVSQPETDSNRNVPAQTQFERSRSTEQIKSRFER